MAAGDEAEAQLASGGPPETDAVAEFYYMREQERAVLQHQAANYRDWETWEMDQAMHRPAGGAARRARHMVVKVEARSSASGCSSEPSMGRSWHMEIPETRHLELSVRVHAEDAVDPEEVDTLLTPETKRRRRELQQQADANSAASPTLDFAQYTALYEQWRAGTLASKQVRNLWGDELLAQFVTTEDNLGEEAPSQGNPLGDEQVKGSLHYVDYEKAYGLWKDGWIREEHVIGRYGLAVMRLMAAQRTRGVVPPTGPSGDGDGGLVVLVPTAMDLDGPEGQGTEGAATLMDGDGTRGTTPDRDADSPVVLPRSS